MRQAPQIHPCPCEVSGPPLKKGQDLHLAARQVLWVVRAFEEFERHLMAEQALHILDSFGQISPENRATTRFMSTLQLGKVPTPGCTSTDLHPVQKLHFAWISSSTSPTRLRAKSVPGVRETSMMVA